jgi:hypothetical protein
MIRVFVVLVWLVNWPVCPTATQIWPAHDTPSKPLFAGSPDGGAAIVQRPPAAVSISVPVGDPRAPDGASELYDLASAPTATQLDDEPHDTAERPLARSSASGLGVDADVQRRLLMTLMMGPVPMSCPTATHAAALLHETPVSPHGPLLRFHSPAPGLGMIDQVAPVRDSTSVFKATGVAW